MSGTKVASVRSPTVVNGVGKYEIVSTCISPGSLPDTGIFLLSIVDAVGPKSDILVRVIEIGDPSVYRNNRDAAVAAKDTQWRSPEVRLQFNDLITANAAQKELSARINTLVTNFDTANTQFTVTNEIITYPAADASVETATIDDFKAARTATATAQTARDAALSQVNSVQADLVFTQTRLADANSDFAALSAVYVAQPPLYSSYKAIQSAINAAVTTTFSQVISSGASAPEKTTISATLSSIELEVQVMISVNATLTAAVIDPTAALMGTLQTRIATLTSKETLQNLNLRQAGVTLTKAQATYDAAQAIENAALAAVRVLCPDFNPATV